jgi:hypothetical protein
MGMVLRKISDSDASTRKYVIDLFCFWTSFRCVVIGVEAMDGLLQACHSQSLNLYVESFLRMVQKLLESPDPNLQILATQSVIKAIQ